jgi:hypothetical protein
MTVANRSMIVLVRLDVSTKISRPRKRYAMSHGKPRQKRISNMLDPIEGLVLMSHQPRL